jgi:hypothetical protein
MTWNPIEQPVDECWLGGYATPGICEVVGASSPRKWDEQAGYAMSGAILIYRGTGLAHFSLNLKLYTLEHWNTWDLIKPILMRPPVGKRANALDVVHPVLNEVGISQLVIEDVGAPEQVEDGVWSISIKCIEWRRYGLGVSKPDGSEATPADPRDVEIGELTDERNMSQLAADGGNP